MSRGGGGGFSILTEEALDGPAYVSSSLSRFLFFVFTVFFSWLPVAVYARGCCQLWFPPPHKYVGCALLVGVVSTILLASCVQCPLCGGFFSPCGWMLQCVFVDHQNISLRVFVDFFFCVHTQKYVCMRVCVCVYVVIVCTYVCV